MRAISLRDRFVNYIHSLQDVTCDDLEEMDQRARFQEDLWIRPGGGGGKLSILEQGRVFEKAGINTYVLHGELSDQVQRELHTGPGYFYSAGIVLAIYPQNPHAPMAHASLRYFEIADVEEGSLRDAWYAGWTELVPTYLHKQDVVQYHNLLKATCDEYNQGFYNRFKRDCDKYFFLRHRGETRGVGGILFNYLRNEDEFSLEDRFEFVTSVGDAFLEGYLGLVVERKDEPYGEAERNFQEYRRSRFVEFNLLLDQGQQFGPSGDGTMESILISLPPSVRWTHNFQAEPGSAEAELQQYLRPTDWVNLKGY